MMTLAPERRGEIAIALLKRQARQDGIKFGPRIKRNLPRVSKELGFSEDELKQFARWLVQELLDESLGD